MKKKILLRFLCVLTTFGLSYPAHSWTAIYNVRVDGSPTLPCGTPGDIPCSSIKTVLNNHIAHDDSEIRLARGAYTDHALIPGSKFSSVKISGGWDQNFGEQQCDPANTLISTKGDDLPLIGSNIYAGENLTITLTCLGLKGADITYRIGIDVSNRSGIATLNLEQVALYSFAGSAISLYTDVGDTNVNIKKAIFENNYQPAGLPTWFGAGLAAASHSGGKTIIDAENSIFANNEARNGGAIFIEARGSGSTTDLTLRNSTVSDNHALESSPNNVGGLLAQGIDNGVTSVNVVNSIIHGNTNTAGNSDISIGASTSPDSMTARYSILGTIHFWLGGTYTDGGHNLNTDPLLDWTYRLKDGSPAIDTAQCGYSYFGGYTRVAPYDDIDGEKRPGFGKLTGCDIGADEHPGSLCLPIKSKSGKFALICL